MLWFKELAKCLHLNPPPFRGGEYRPYTLMVCLTLLLSGCGFTPMYGEAAHGDSAAQELNFVAIDNIPDRPGQELRNLLIDRFYVDGRPEKTIYRLQIALTSTEAELGIQSDGTSTRTQLSLTAKYTLLDNQDKMVLSGIARSLVSYSILNAQYGTLVARQDALSRGLSQVSQEITNRLGAALHAKVETATE